VSLAAVLVTGMFAGGVSCAAVQGGLLTGLVARQQAATASAVTQSRTSPRRAADAATRSQSGGGARPVAGTRAAPAKQTRTAAQRACHAPPPPKPWTARLADDLAPVGGFLTGKLLSHTVLGALLGALGTVAQFSPQTRAMAQLAAGALIIAFGLAQLDVPGFRGFTVSAPASWARFVRGRARSQSALAPGELGAPSWSPAGSPCRSWPSR
jgi:hypothetical protein